MSHRNRNCDCKKCVSEEQCNERITSNKIIVECISEFVQHKTPCFQKEEIHSHNGETDSHNRETYSNNRETDSHNRETHSPNRETDSYNCGTPSMFVWSSMKQTNRDIRRFQYVTFENPPIGPVNSGWTIYTQQNYQYPTNFIVPVCGWYMITYSVVICPGSCSCESIILLTHKGVEIAGSSTLVKGEAHKTVLANLTGGDSIALLFWSSDKLTQLGVTFHSTGIMPSGSSPKEVTASISFTKLSNR